MLVFYQHTVVILLFYSCFSLPLFFENNAQNATSYPGSLILPPPGGGKMRNPGNEVARGLSASADFASSTFSTPEHFITVLDSGAVFSDNVLASRFQQP